MAEIPVLAAAEEASAAGKSKKWLIISLLAGLLLIGGGAGAWLLLSQGTSHGSKAAPAPEPPRPPLYVPLDPPFVVNFEGDQVARFLQVTVQVMTRDAGTVDLIKAHDPVVRNDLLMLLANQKYDVIATREGKEKLRSEALAAVRHVIAGAGGKPENIEQVYFTSFVMQ